jgi:hypothetical protein
MDMRDPEEFGERIRSQTDSLKSLLPWESLSAYP